MKDKEKIIRHFVQHVLPGFAHSAHASLLPGRPLHSPPSQRPKTLGRRSRMVLPAHRQSTLFDTRTK